MNKRLRKKLKELLAILTDLRRRYIYKVALNSIGLDPSPLDRADDVLGCVESVTEILKKAGAFPKITTGTYTFYFELARSRHWAPTAKPREGDIVISPTGMGNGKIRGHVGIFAKNGVIMSNDSWTGKWQANYDIDRWNARYRDIGGMPVHYFTFIA